MGYEGKYGNGKSETLNHREQKEARRRLLPQIYADIRRLRKAMGKILAMEGRGGGKLEKLKMVIRGVSELSSKIGVQLVFETLEWCLSGVIEGADDMVGCIESGGDNLVHVVISIGGKSSEERDILLFCCQFGVTGVEGLCIR